MPGEPPAPPETAQSLRETAELGVRRAGALLRERFLGVRTIEYKGGIDLVTDADRASEAELLAFIRSRHPGHSVLAEESGLSSSSGPDGDGGGVMRWFVDPLDGTTNYAHRVPHFCVTVGVARGAELLAGAVYDPVRDELFSAAKGAGATLNGQPIRASQAATLQRALVCTGFPYDVREHPEAPVGLFNRIIRQVQGVRRMGAAALDLAYVAAGRFDGYFEFGLKPWDVAAGALLVREAGGRMCQIDGAPLDLMVGDVLACGAGLAADLEREVAGFLRDIRWTPRRYAPRPG
ncbi:MAG TPA: inositol monophosphatase family protein [Myxococcales bacterium]|nr:inositol monophosphatase family protein [Myxococcales bacterium]